VIVKFEGRDVRGARALRWEVACSQVGSLVALHVLREGRLVRLQATLRKAPGQKAAAFGKHGLPA
jgi:S1-C subfamily serine protease